MSSYEAIQKYTADEVKIWVECLGFNSTAFFENGVDGDLLCTLTGQDLQNDLGMDFSEATTLLEKLEFTKALTTSNNRGAAQSGGDPQQMNQLKAENAQLKSQLAELQSIDAALASPPPPQQRAPPPPPQPVQHQPPPPPPRQPQGPGVIGGAAGGALGGAAKGAIMGAILPGMDASDGAKAGAAVGAFSGGTRALGRRRRRF